MHTHSRAGLAISCLKMGLEPIIQDAAMFHNRVSYHEWEGMSTNAEAVSYTHLTLPTKA